MPRPLRGCVVCALLFLSVPAPGAELSFHLSGLPQLDVPALSDIIKAETGVTLVRASSTQEPLAAVASGEVDLAVVENTQPFRDGVRTVLPLYRSVVHLARSQSLDWSRLIEEQRAPLIELAGATHAAGVIAQLLFERASVVTAQHEIWNAESPAPPDVTVYVGPLMPSDTAWFRNDFELVSMSRIDPEGAEFYSDGISHLVPQIVPFRIPALTYTLPGNETGIDALAVDMLLVTRRDMDPDVIYRVVQVLLEQKARFAAAQPQVFRWLREDFPQDDLNFPLHRGTRNYLHRDDPGFLERYAEALNFIVYLVALAVTGAVAFGRWRARQRKDRIDRFYARLITLRNDSVEGETAPLLREIKALEDEAFDLLIRERLAADESFRIFMDLARSLRRELEGRHG